MKVAFTVFAWLMCDNNVEYKRLFAVSSLIWAGVEACLQFFGTRKIQSMKFWGVTIPLPLSLMLQGTQEAGFVCIYGTCIRACHACPMWTLRTLLYSAP